MRYMFDLYLWLIKRHNLVNAEEVLLSLRQSKIMTIKKLIIIVFFCFVELPISTCSLSLSLDLHSSLLYMYICVCVCVIAVVLKGNKVEPFLEEVLDWIQGLH